MAGDVLDPVAQVRATLEASARVKLAVAAALAEPIARAGEWVAAAYRAGGKTLLFGNGGSAADAQHIAAEWVGKLGPDRAALPSIALSANTSDLTAIGNDYGFERVFARQVEAYGQPGDVLLVLSTSGRSPNVLAAAEAARARGIAVVALTGAQAGPLGAMADEVLAVPEADTARVQEVHLTLLHVMCDEVERALVRER